MASIRCQRKQSNLHKGRGLIEKKVWVSSSVVSTAGLVSGNKAVVESREMRKRARLEFFETSFN